MDWFFPVAVPVASLAGVVFTVVWSTRKGRPEIRVAESTANESAISSRFDDASELARYVREQVEAEVERQVKPFRDKLVRVEKESHQMNTAVRANVTQQWLWDQRGRIGALPMLPAPILTQLGIGNLADEWPTEPATPTT